MLEIINLRKTFNPGTVNEKTALDGVSLTLRDGDFVSVICNFILSSSAQNLFDRFAAHLGHLLC